MLSHKETDTQLVLNVTDTVHNDSATRCLSAH